MSDWFTIEIIDTDTYAISEYSHWEETHCYLLCGTHAALLIDTGLGVGNIKDVVTSLTTLPVMVTTTHVHWDHIGGHRYFECFSVHQEETSWIKGNFPLSLDVVKRNLLEHACVFPSGFHPDQYQIFSGNPTTILQDQDHIDIGNRCVTVIHTPGHSPGHCCFYEEARQYLFSGDLIYQSCLDAFYPTTDPQQFFQSVAKISRLHVTRVLPAHHNLDIPVSLINSIYRGFADLNNKGILKHGTGFFEFGDFQIHI